MTTPRPGAAASPEGISVAPERLDPNLRVSVLMLTYNQVAYVAQAIESALAQDAPFRYELVIGEDCSTDGTRALVAQYAARYPDRIRVLLPDRNRGMHWNFIHTLRACRGQYVAFLEGDDYWTAPDKLRKQVEFLDAHPGYSMCFHPVDGDVADHLQWVAPRPPIDQTSFEIEHLLSVCFIATCSMLCRNGLVTELPRWFLTLGMADWPFQLLQAAHGSIGRIEDTMAAYRVHPGGAWSAIGQLRRFREEITLLEYMDRHFGSRYAPVIHPELARRWAGVASLVLDDGRRRGCLAGALAEFSHELEHRPSGAEVEPRLKARLLGQFQAARAFEAHAARDRRGVQRALIAAARLQPALLRDRGLWSIGMESLVGRQLSDSVRRVARRVGPAQAS